MQHGIRISEIVRGFLKPTYLRRRSDISVPLNQVLSLVGIPLKANRLEFILKVSLKEYKNRLLLL